MSEINENIILKWPAIASLDREEFELSIPYGFHGVVRVYKVPKCEAYPEGYFVSISTDNYNEVEPGCRDEEKVKLFVGHLSNNDSKTSRDEGTGIGNRRLDIEMHHPDVIPTIIVPEPVLEEDVVEEPSTVTE